MNNTPVLYLCVFFFFGCNFYFQLRVMDGYPLFQLAVQKFLAFFSQKREKVSTLVFISSGSLSPYIKISINFLCR